MALPKVTSKVADSSEEVKEELKVTTTTSLNRDRGTDPSTTTTEEEVVSIPTTEEKGMSLVVETELKMRKGSKEITQRERSSTEEEVRRRELIMRKAFNLKMRTLMSNRRRTLNEGISLLSLISLRSWILSKKKSQKSVMRIVSSLWKLLLF